MVCWTIGCLVGLAQPKATFDKKIHDFGVVLWKHPATAVFTVKNEGDKPLVISNVTTSCGCALADWTKTPIAPGMTGTVSATFDAKALGHFQKSVGVYCNASVRPLYLTLRGEVSADPKNYTLTHPYEVGAIRLNKDVIEVLDLYVYNITIASGGTTLYSFATAIGILKTIVSVTLLFSANFASKKLRGESIM